MAVTADCFRWIGGAYDKSFTKEERNDHT
jgi:hypothetical protein